MPPVKQIRKFNLSRLVTGSVITYDANGKKSSPVKQVQGFYRGMDMEIEAVIPGDGKTMTIGVVGTDIAETLEAPGYLRFDIDNLNAQVEGYGSTLPADLVIQGQAANFVRLGKFKSVEEAITALTPKPAGK